MPDDERRPPRHQEGNSPHRSVDRTLRGSTQASNNGPGMEAHGVERPQLMKDPNRGTRWNVVSGIYVFAGAATNAIPFLVSALQDSDEQVRRAATNSLRQVMLLKPPNP